MEEITPEYQDLPEQPVILGETLAEAPNQNNQYNLDIIDTKDITSTYTSTAKPVLNINWDLENPIASEAGLVSSGSSGSGGLGNVSNTLVTGSFRRSEIDNLLGRNTSVFVSNITNELFGNGNNAANQISTQQPRPILARKRLIKIIDIWNRIIFGMNINARDNASLNRFFGANIQTNADVLFRNQITVTTPAPNSVTYNEFNSWTHLVGPDQAFIFSQISRFIVACIYELKEKIKLLNSIVQGTESLVNQNIENIINNTDTFNIPDNYLNDYITLTEPAHIIPDATHKIWNWSVAPTNTASKFQALGAFAKHIPQKYSIMLFEPSFLLLLQELIDTIMELPEESHFREIFQNTIASGLNPKDLKLVELLGLGEPTSGDGNQGGNQKITFDSVKLKGIVSCTFLETSHLNFNYIYYFYLKHKNDFDFLNETNTYNTKKRKYRFLEDLNTWNTQRKLRKDWEEQKLAYEESIEKDLEPVIGNLLVEYPLDVPNPENPESIPGPFVAGVVHVDEKHKNINHDPFLKYCNIHKTHPLPESDTDLILGNFQKYTITFNGGTYNFSGAASFIKTTFKDGYKIHAFNHSMNITNYYLTFIFDKNFNCVNVLSTPWLIQDPNFSYVQIGNKIIFHNPIYDSDSSFDSRRYTSTCEINNNGDLVNFNTTYYKRYNDPLQKTQWNFKNSVVIGNFIYVLGGEYIRKFEFDNNLNIISYNQFYRSGFSGNDILFYHNGYLYNVGASGNNRNSISIRVLNNNELSTTINSTPMIFPDAGNNQRYSGLLVDKDKIYCKYSTGNNPNITLVSYNISDGILSNRQEIKNIPLNNDDINYSIMLGSGEMFGDNLLVAYNNSRYFAVCKINRNNIPTNNNEYFIERKTYQGPTKPVPLDASFNLNPVTDLRELRKYDFVDDKTYHQPYTENTLYKFPVYKPAYDISYKADTFKDWVLLQQEAYDNLDKLIEVFTYCSDLTSPVVKRAQWNNDSKTVVNNATRYDVGNRIDRILQLNTSKLSNRLGIEYFKSLDNYKTKIDNGELPIDAPVPVPFFKNKIFSTEMYTGLSGSGQTTATQRNWRFGWTTVKFPKKFELSPGNFIEATKYLPCSWFNSASNELLFARQFIDITDPDDEMYIGFYNASTSFGVTVQMEELFRQRHPLLTGTEHMHGTSLVQANTLKAQIHSNFFKLEFIGDSTGKYFPVTIDEINNMELSPNSLTRESIAKADIFVNVKPDNDYVESTGGENDEKFFIENPANPKDVPFIDSFKNLKLFYRLN